MPLPISVEVKYLVMWHFIEGRFSVLPAGDNPFRHLPVDQTTEVTVNKDTKIAARVIALRQKPLTDST